MQRPFRVSIPSDAAACLERLSEAEGLTPSAWIRRLVVRDVGLCTCGHSGRHEHERASDRDGPYQGACRASGCQCKAFKSVALRAFLADQGNGSGGDR
jgi:hypothetical protein